MSYPARDPNAIAVGASTDEGALAGYSNVGGEIAFVAPSSGGVRGIFTTDVSCPGRGFNTGNAVAAGADGLQTSEFGGTSPATARRSAAAASTRGMPWRLRGWRADRRRQGQGSRVRLGKHGK